jgi:hypothetical protein
MPSVKDVCIGRFEAQITSLVHGEMMSPMVCTYQYVLIRTSCLDMCKYICELTSTFAYVRFDLISSRSIGFRNRDAEMPLVTINGHLGCCSYTHNSPHIERQAPLVRTHR